MGAGEAVAAGSQAAADGAPPSQGSGSVRGNCVRAGGWVAVAAGASADRLLRDDRLAAVAGVAARRGVGATAPRSSPPLEILQHRAMPGTDVGGLWQLGWRN